VAEDEDDAAREGKGREGRKLFRCEKAVEPSRPGI
jgi:hypothetical protein